MKTQRRTGVGFPSHSRPVLGRQRPFSQLDTWLCNLWFCLVHAFSPCALCPSLSLLYKSLFSFTSRFSLAARSPFLQLFPLFCNSLLSFALALLCATRPSCFIVPYPRVSLQLVRLSAPLALPALLSATCVPLSLAVHHPTAVSSYTKWSAAGRRTPRRGRSWGCNFRPRMVPYASLGTPDSRCDWRLRILPCFVCYHEFLNAPLWVSFSPFH
jgi:hypothetical protein